MTGAGESPDVELFGPILQTWRAKTFDEGRSHLANATRYGLSAALISQDPETVRRLLGQPLRAGIIQLEPTDQRCIVRAHRSAASAGRGNHRPSAYLRGGLLRTILSSATRAEQTRASIGIGLRDG